MYIQLETTSSNQTPNGLICELTSCIELVATETRGLVDQTLKYERDGPGRCRTQDGGQQSPGLGFLTHHNVLTEVGIVSLTFGRRNTTLTLVTDAYMLLSTKCRSSITYWLELLLAFPTAWISATYGSLPPPCPEHGGCFAFSNPSAPKTSSKHQPGPPF